MIFPQKLLGEIEMGWGMGILKWALQLFSPSLWKRGPSPCSVLGPRAACHPWQMLAFPEIPLLNTCCSHSWRQLARQRAQKRGNISPLCVFVEAFCRWHGQSLPVTGEGYMCVSIFRLGPGEPSHSLRIKGGEKKTNSLAPDFQSLVLLTSSLLLWLSLTISTNVLTGIYFNGKNIISKKGCQRSALFVMVINVFHIKAELPQWDTPVSLLLAVNCANWVSDVPMERQWKRMKWRWMNSNTLLQWSENSIVSCSFNSWKSQVLSFPIW